MAKTKIVTPLMTRTPEQAEEFRRRVKAGLAKARRRGVKLGAPKGSRYLASYIEKNGNGPAIAGIQAAAQRYYDTIRPILTKLRKDHPDWSYAQLAEELQRRKVKTRRDKTEWHATSVHRLLVMFEYDQEEAADDKAAAIER